MRWPSCGPQNGGYFALVFYCYNTVNITEDIQVIMLLLSKFDKLKYEKHY